MIPRPEVLRREQVAQRWSLLTFTCFYVLCLAAGWFGAAAYTYIERGPEVAPW